MKNVKKTILSVIIILFFISFVYLFVLYKNQSYKTSCIDKMKSFLVWYKENFLEISNAQNSIIVLDFKEYYKPKYDKIDSYISLLKYSGYFSDIFLDKFKNHLVGVANNLLSKKQNDGPPEGFDYDFFFGQEYSYYFGLIPDKIEIKSIKSDNGIETILIAGFIEYTFDESCYIRDIGRNGESFYNDFNIKNR